MLRVSWADIVLWLHIVAACVWIGGQIVVAIVIPLLRENRPLGSAIGRRFQAVAWPAFLVLLATGIVNVGNAGLSWSRLLDSPAGRTLLVKLGLVAVSGLAAGVHAFLQAPRKDGAVIGRQRASALLGSASLLAALGAALYGVVIAHG